jgi:hypothetical protein
MKGRKNYQKRLTFANRESRLNREKEFDRNRREIVKHVSPIPIILAVRTLRQHYYTLWTLDRSIARSTSTMVCLYIHSEASEK